MDFLDPLTYFNKGMEFFMHPLFEGKFYEFYVVEALVLIIILITIYTMIQKILIRAPDYWA